MWFIAGRTEILDGSHPLKIQKDREKHMTKTALFATMILWGGLSLAKAEDKTEDIFIPTDNEPPASAEELVPKHPFFAEPTSGNEVFESVEEQRLHIQKLDERVTRLEADVKALKQEAL